MEVSSDRADGVWSIVECCSQGSASFEFLRLGGRRDMLSLVADIASREQTKRQPQVERSLLTNRSLTHYLVYMYT